MEDTLLKLEAGKDYITRNGLITSRLENITYGGNYKFEGKVKEYPDRLPTATAMIKRSDPIGLIIAFVMP